MPTATPFMLHVYAAMAEAEGIAISTRTKTALAAAKARGAKLGNPRLLAGSPGQARMVVTRDFFCSCYCIYHRNYIYIYWQRAI